MADFRIVLHRWCCALAMALAASLAALPAMAATQPYGDLQIRFDGVPVVFGPGTGTWTGSTKVALTLDTDTQTLSGSGNFPFKQEMKAGCLAACNGTIPLTVSGKASIGVDAIEVRYQATTMSCTITCGRTKSFKVDKVGVADDKISLPHIPDAEVASSLSDGAPGPKLFYKLAGDCAGDGSSGMLVPEVRPGKKAWSVAELKLLSVGGIQQFDREHGGKHPDTAVGYTFASFNSSTDSGVKTRPSGSSGVCYWVDKPVQTMDPIDVGLPGATWPEGLCEFDAVRLHEVKHVADAKAKYDNYASEWIAAVKKAGLPTAARPAKAASEDEAKTTLNARLKAITDPIAAKWLRLFATSRDHIDTQAETNRTMAKCPGGWHQ